MKATATTTTTRKATKTPNEVLVARITPSVLKAWAKDVRALGTNRLTDHGIKGLIWTKDGGFEYDVFGLLLDRITDQWVLGRESGVHEGMSYYNALVNGSNDFNLWDVLDTRFGGSTVNAMYQTVRSSDVNVIADAILAMG